MPLSERQVRGGQHWLRTTVSWKKAMSRLTAILSHVRCHSVVAGRLLSTSCRRCVRGGYRIKGRDEDGDYDVDYEHHANRNFNKPVPGNYTEDYSLDAKEAARLDGQKNFEGFPLINQYGLWDYKHTPKVLREKEFAGPLCEDKVGIRYPGYWIKGKFHYVKEMEPELIVPDLTNFPLKPYVSYRTADVQQPELTAKALFNLVYADDVYKQFLKGEVNEDEEIPVEEMTEAGEKARTEAEKTGSDRFVPNSWYGIGIDKFD